MSSDTLLSYRQDLQRFNTLGLPSTAQSLVSLQTTDQLDELSRLAARFERVFVLGGGSNVVLAPVLDSLVIRVETCGIRLLHETATHYVVEAAAGENWHAFVQACLQQGWAGLENLALIPGTVGAAPVQNIGAYGLEIDQRLHSILAWELSAGQWHELLPHECGFAYRDSLFKRAPQGQWLIAAVRFQLPKTWQALVSYPDLAGHPHLCSLGDEPLNAWKVFEAVCEIRQMKLPDPAVLGNAGSFFKNPLIDAETCQKLKSRFPGLPVYPVEGGGFKVAAGWLIEQAGWKGRRMGNVGMHERQALVLVNYGGATANEVTALASAVCEDVAQLFGVRLEQEPVQVA